MSSVALTSAYTAYLKQDYNLCINQKALSDCIHTKFIDSFMNYINKLPNEIKGLPFNTGQYSKSTFENVFRKYYKQRVSYINEKLIDKKRVTQKTEDDFWNS